MALVLNASKQSKKEFDPNDVLIQDESEHQKIKEIKKSFHFSEKRIAMIKEMYQTVVVRDFEDEYHESVVEDTEMDEMYKSISRLKSRYRKIHEFIEAMRKCYRFVKFIAKRNKMFVDPEEFISDTMNGIIEIYGLKFPKYSGPDKKDINWNEVAKYIYDEELDPMDLVENDKKEKDDLDVKYLKNPEDHLDKFFTEEEIELIFNQKYEEGAQNKSQVKSFSRKEFKTLMKTAPDLVRPLKNFSKRLSAEDALKSFAYELEDDAFEIISKMDEKRGFTKKAKTPKFKGSLLDKDAVRKHLYELDEFNDQHEYVNYHGSIISLERYKDEKFKEGLHESGWNLRKLYDNKEIEKKRKKEQKKDRKKEERLRRELTKLENKKRGNEGESIKKKKKKVKKKYKKLYKGFSDTLANMNGFEDFDEYKESMLDMSWGLD